MTLRSDSEPSTLSLLQSARKTLSSLGVTCHVETAPVGSHQSNGAAEETVHLVRQLAIGYMQQLEHNGGAPGPVFKSMHPVVAWSLIHAAWVRNHFAVGGVRRRLNELLIEATTDVSVLSERMFCGM